MARLGSPKSLDWGRATGFENRSVAAAAGDTARLTSSATVVATAPRVSGINRRFIIRLPPSLAEVVERLARMDSDARCPPAEDAGDPPRSVGSSAQHSKLADR